MRIDAVAVEASAQLVIEPAPRHLLAASAKEVLHSIPPLLVHPGLGGEEELEAGGGGELRCGAEAAVLGVRLPEQLIDGPLEHMPGNRKPRAAPGALLQRGEDASRVLLHALPVLVPGARHGQKDLPEGGKPVPRLGREVGARVEGLPPGLAEDGQRPATVALQTEQDVHVDLVDVGTLLAVHLDGDEVRIDQGRQLRVFEGLLLHHVAPVAGAVADRDQQRPR